MINYKKMDACGNDFIAINYDDFKKINNPYIFAVKICDRKNIGADGIITDLPSKNYDFKFLYINYMGYNVPFCGHAIRSLSFLNYIYRNKKYEMIIETEIGIRKTIIEELKEKSAFIGLEFENFEVGVRHYVKRVEDINNFDLESEAKEFFKSSDEHFNIYSEIELGKIAIRTWEYGHQKEALSCATGSLACALSYSKEKKLNYIEVIPKSKKPIFIEILKDKAILWSYIEILNEGVIYESHYL